MSIYTPAWPAVLTNGEAIALGLVPRMSVESKFGRNSDISTGTEVLWPSGAGLTFAAAAQTLNVVSSSATDAAAQGGAEQIKIFGLDANYAEISDTVTMTGVTPATTTAAFLRVNRAYVVAVDSRLETNVGNISITQTTSGTLMAYIAAARGQTEQAIYTVPAGKKAIFIGARASVDGSNEADINMWQADYASGGAKRNVGSFVGLVGVSSQFIYGAPASFAAKTDLWADATVAGSNYKVTASFDIILAPE